MAGPYEGERLYQTSIAGNAVIIATFAALLPAVLVLGYRYHTVAFTITLTTGIILEILGFAGRLLLNSREGNQSFFTLYFLGTILGPSFIASAIFSILPHLILIYHNGISPLKSGHVGLVFVSLVLLNVLLEIVGAIFTVFGATEEIVSVARERQSRQPFQQLSLANTHHLFLPFSRLAPPKYSSSPRRTSRPNRQSPPLRWYPVVVGFQSQILRGKRRGSTRRRLQLG